MMGIMIGLAALLGGFVQAISGFGSGTVLMAVFPYFLTMLEAPALSTSICIVINTSMTWKYRKYINWKKVAYGFSVYTILCFWALGVAGKLNLDSLRTAFGVFLVVLSLYFLFLSKKASIKPNRVSETICMGISGLCAGFFGIGGPLMGLYYLQATDSKEEYLASINIVFTINSVISMIIRAQKGYYPLSLLPYTLIGMVLAFTGMKIGHKVSKKLDIVTFRKIVYIVVGLSGLITLLKKIL